MTLRTIGSPFDPETLSELQAKIGTYKGVLWARMSSAQQAAYQRIIDASAEYLTKRFGHEPWMQHEEALSLSSGTSTFSLSAAARHVITIVETYAGRTRLAGVTTKQEWLKAWGSGAATHPWSAQETPYYFFDGMTADNPPRQQWKRVPTPDAAVTGTILVRPYLTLREAGGDSDKENTHIPANAAQAQADYILYRVDKHDKNFESSAFHKQAMEDEISAIQVADNPEGGIEAPRQVDVPAYVYREMEP